MRKTAGTQFTNQKTISFVEAALFHKAVRPQIVRNAIRLRKASDTEW